MSAKEPTLEEQLANLAPTVNSVKRDRIAAAMKKRDGGYTLATDLPTLFAPEEIVPSEPGTPQNLWYAIGQLCKNNNRLYDALAIYDSLYRHMHRYQIAADKPIHKGMPLVWMCDCFLLLGYPVHAKRYLMYTLCEDAIQFGPEKRAEDSGVYFRAVWQHGIPDQLVSEYTKAAHEKYTELGSDGWFPERILAELDDRWMSDSPSEMEFGRYWSNPLYVRHLIDKLGTDKGKSLEWLAHYLVSLIPGARAYRRKFTPSTDYDVVGSFEGPGLDFRSELGRYFVCECKDWNSTADFTTFAKLARVLDSVKSRFGILFAKEGISGEGITRYAEREQLKVFADRGIAIVVITLNDLVRIEKGESFLSMLRTKYETVRLDVY